MTYAVRNVRAVLPDTVLDDATIVVEDGIITSVKQGGAAPSDAYDGLGAFCFPGLIDTHSDGLEKELRPRPQVDLPADFAVRSFEGRVRAAGVTTLYHGVGFENGAKYQRSIALANSLCDAIERRAAGSAALIDHRILYRLDARDREGFEALQRRLPIRVDDGAKPLVSFEDHTPGQGQYSNRRQFEIYIAGSRGVSDDVARKIVDELIIERDQLLVNREQALPWLTHAAGTGTIRLMAHDPVSADDVDDAASWNAAIAEFPTTIDAARRAQKHGLRTVSGGPNVLRGQSHSGNISAAELISLGLCNGLASDYMPSTLVGAVGVLVNRGVCGLPQAVALVTSGPAETVGLTDRGRLEPGLRGDLAVVASEGSWLTVRAVFRPEDNSIDGSVVDRRVRWSRRGRDAR